MVGELLTPGTGATATLRNDGTVLVAGGRDHLYSDGSAWLFAPECGGFLWTGSLFPARDGHTATLLLDGTVLVTGGTIHTCVPSGPRSCDPKTLVLSSAELFK